MWESFIVPESTSYLATFSFPSEDFLLAVLTWSVVTASIVQPFSPERGANNEELVTEQSLWGVGKEFLNQRKSLLNFGAGALTQQT